MPFVSQVIGNLFQSCQSQSIGPLWVNSFNPSHESISLVRKILKAYFTCVAASLQFGICKCSILYHHKTSWYSLPPKYKQIFPTAP